MPQLAVQEDTLSLSLHAESFRIICSRTKASSLRYKLPGSDRPFPKCFKRANSGARQVAADARYVMNDREGPCRSLILHCSLTRHGLTPTHRSVGWQMDEVEARCQGPCHENKRHRRRRRTCHRSLWRCALRAGPFCCELAWRRYWRKRPGLESTAKGGDAMEIWRQSGDVSGPALEAELHIV